MLLHQDSTQKEGVGLKGAERAKKGATYAATYMLPGTYMLEMNFMSLNRTLVGLMILFALIILAIVFLPPFHNQTSQQIPADSPWAGSQQNPDGNSRITDEATPPDFGKLLGMSIVVVFVFVGIILICKLLP